MNCVQVFQPGATPLFTVLRHQGKQCNPRYDGGGVAEDNATKAWYRDLAGAIGDDRVVIAFEPDSIGTIECLATLAAVKRARICCATASTCYRKLPNATIYLEGTASDWKSARFTALAAALHRHRQGARVHAQRDPLRLDVEEHRATGGGCRGWWAASRSWSPRPTTAAGRCPTRPAAGSA